MAFKVVLNVGERGKALGRGVGLGGSLFACFLD